MDTLIFDAEKEFTYHWCGTFVSPNCEWTHLSRPLNDYELMVVTDGELHISDGNTDYHVLPGEYLLMPPCSNQHGVKSSHCSFYWLHFGYHNEQNDHAFFQDDIPVYSPGRLLLPIQGELRSLDRIIVLMKQLQDSDRRHHEFTLNRYLCSAILSEVAAQSPLYQSYGSKVKKEQFYNDIQNYIQWHLSESLHVSDIADYFGYNEKYLTTFFRKVAGIPLKQYILSAKMEHAKAMLTETNQPVSQIAYGLGFSDAHNFSNAFRKIAGISPSEYRTSYSKRNVFQV